MKKKRIKDGYTLIELLATVFIIAIVITIALIPIASKIKTSKKISTSLTEENIADSAVLYTKEYNSSLQGWHYDYDEDGNPNTNSKYYCVTVGELINNGYFSDSILNGDINRNTYVKVTKNEENKTYSTSGIINSSNNTDICQKYVISFIDRYNNLIKINGEEQRIVVDSGYQLTASDFPELTNQPEYNKFTEGPSTFAYNGTWGDESGEIVSEGYVVRKDIVAQIKYSLESGSGDAYLLTRGFQRPFAGEGDSSDRYTKATDIVLTDNDDTSLADFVLNCPNTSNCVLSLDTQNINNYLTLETKNNLSDIESIDWYVLKYVSGVWHLDGQKYSSINVGFINQSKITDNNGYANCLFLNTSGYCNYSGYNLALSIYEEDLSLMNVKITYSTGKTKEYTLDDFTKVEDDERIFSTNVGYYTKEQISKTDVKNIKTVVIKYQQNGETLQATYEYTYNVNGYAGIYQFKLRD